MPELPWEKWYPTNWASEPGLRLCEAATRGIWIELINTMMLQQTDRITANEEQLASLCFCRTSQIQLAIAQLKDFKVAEIEMHNGCTTIINRRRARDLKIRHLKQKAANKRWSTTDAHTVQGEDARSASASAYTSNPNGKGCGENQSGAVLRISQEKELERINQELSKMGKLSDYCEGSKPYLRRVMLLNRQKELRSQMGVVA